ncbi:MAG TPA: matrixin family metalloprotease [Longimicrobium sp.]|nr:matrixin family metalloprotease [Longimicrobium sp.]
MPAPAFLCAGRRTARRRSRDAAISIALVVAAAWASVDVPGVHVPPADFVHSAARMAPRRSRKLVELRRRIVPRRRRKLRPVELVPAGEVHAALLHALGGDLAAALGVQWSAGDALPLREEWRDAESGLYRSVYLIHALMNRAASGVDGEAPRWRLAIGDIGLCAEGVGDVFGEAAQEGCCAVIGLAPLRAGSGADAGVLRARLLSEAVHELGHLAGLSHCRRASCVMYPSRDIADTDLKGASFCNECRRSLKLRGLQDS